MDDFTVRSFLEHGRQNILGLIFCLFLFFMGFAIHGNTGLYLNLSGFAIVMGGTFGATLISYKMNRLVILVRVLMAFV